MDIKCSSYTYKSVKLLLDYITQLKEDNLSVAQKDNELKDLRSKVLQLEQQIAKNVEKDQLIELYKASAANRADTNAERIKELHDTNTFYKQIIEQKSKNDISAQGEIDQLRKIISETFKKDFQTVLDSLDHIRGQSEEFNKIREQFDIELRKHVKIINENRETISELKAQVESKDSELKKIQTELNERDNTIARLQKDLESNTNSLTQTEIEFNELKVTLKKQNETVLEQVKEISKLTVESKNCSEILKKQKEQKPTSCTSFTGTIGTLQIEVPGFEPINVLCDNQIAGSGWIVIQQRINGYEDFRRDWATYKKGFGNFEGDFFLGLENIHRLTSARRHELYIYMERFSGATSYARYDNFRINDESDQYRLSSLGAFTGSAADNLRKHLNYKFSTKDRDNDIWSGNCAESYKGGWWFNACVDW